MENRNQLVSVITPRAHDEDYFDIELPPRALKEHDGKAYIIHKRKIYRAKRLKNGMLEVKASQTTWRVKIA